VNQELDIRGLLGRSIPCGCGRTHVVSTKCVDIGAGALGRLGRTLESAGLEGRALVVADGNTWEAAGGRAAEELKAAGYECDPFVFPDGELHTDERAIGSVLMALGDADSFIVAVGSGTINDTCRFVAKRTGLPYIVIGTAPSMDGYASAVSPAVRGGFKATYKGVAPLAVVGDTDVLRRAPKAMTAAGLGDVFGKITARLDWLMAERIMGEYRCEAVAGIMQKAVDACLAGAPGLPGGGAEALEGLMRALTLSGIAMQMVNDSRPASGAEHQVAHFFEMLDGVRGRHSGLHGDKVGIAELLLMRLYEKFFEPEFPAVCEPGSRQGREDAMRRDLGPFADVLLAENCSAAYACKAVRRRALEEAEARWDFYRNEAAALPAQRIAGEDLIRRAGGPVRPGELGYGRADTLHALKYAMELREKFTVLRLAHLSGRLDGIAEELADEFC
jgi:glycerol-1-phosphate dehydrogenase [NAD(P)+]